MVKKSKNIEDELKSILNLSSNKIKNRTILRNDILAKLNDSPEYIDKYKNSYAVKKELISIYDEINDKNNSRKIFSPGLFVGLQGRINCAIISRHVIENVLKMDFATAVHKLNYKILYKHKLRSIKQCFDSIYSLLIETYPERNLKPYYFKKHKNVWFNESGEMDKLLVKEAIREFIEILTNQRGKYKYKLKTIPKWITYKHFQKNILPYNANLSYMLNKCFKNSPIDAIIFAYPELNLKPHYFRHVPKGYWKGSSGKENAKVIMNELFERLTDPNGLYKLNKEEVYDLMKYKTYHKPLLPYGKKLGGMLQAIFENSPTAPLELIEDKIICNEICELCEQENNGCCMNSNIKFGKDMSSI